MLSGLLSSLENALNAMMAAYDGNCKNGECMSSYVSQLSKPVLQILGITSRAGGVDPRSINMGPHSDQPMMATPQAPVHARLQHGAQGYNAFPSFQDIAAGLAAAGELPLQSSLIS